MSCCSECFKSPYLKDKIIRNNSKGNCNFCGGKSVFIIDPRELSYSFQSIFDLYQINEDGGNAVNQILADFPNLIFAEIEFEIIDSLLRTILVEDLETYGQYLEKSIILECNQNQDFKSEIDSLHLTWENFVSEIKSINRFHIKNVFDFEKLEHLLKINSVKLPKGKIYYRGRISDKNGYLDHQMWNPPNHLAKSGRANPVGISYLYIANDLTTTLFETRASLYDYVTIGEFRLKEDLLIVDLKEIGRQDPFDLAQNELLEDYLTYLPFLKRLSSELSRPIRRQDSELDYLPTQYLCEFIKSFESDGVAYGSSLNISGKNLAIFSPEKFECINVNVYEITNIDFGHQQVKEIEP